MFFLKKITTGSTTKRIWWTIMFVLCLAACSHLIIKIWDKWNQSPVIVSFAESSTPIWQVPFPAVTICSETKARQTVYNFTEMYHRDKDNFTEEERFQFESISLVCDNHLLQKGSKFTNYSAVDFISEVAPPFDELVWYCKWKTTVLNCSEFFSPLLTEDGICYTFNMLTANELFNSERLHEKYHYLEHGKISEGWTNDDGYPPNLPLDTYPIRGTGSGTKAGLSIVLRANNSDLDYLCRGPVQGFKVLLHSPAEIPQVGSQYFRVPLSQEVIAAIKPNMMITSEGLKSYDPMIRQCFFPKEKHLKFFQSYTQGNCELECLTNYTMLMCNCVTVSMPREPNMPICSAGSVECVTKASADLLTRKIKGGLLNNTMVMEGDKEWETIGIDKMDEMASRCNCLPSCTSINYDAEISQADYDWKQLLLAFKTDLDTLPEINMARLVLFFKESHFITSKRSELYGQTDFLANCGGLLGLFLGFSILSLVEIIYFITLRAFCNLRNKISKTSMELTDDGIKPTTVYS